MSEIPFYRTQMGHRFFEHTVPEFVRQVGRVADAIERLAAALENRVGAPPQDPSEEDK